MKIAVTGDTHGDAAGWRQMAEKIFPGADLVVHCGDILAHGPRNPLVEGYDPAGLAELINAGPVPVLFARGNCDAEVDQLLIDFPIQSPYAFFQAGPLRIMAHHGHGLSREEMIEMCRRYRADLFASGHTHVPALERAGGLLLVNPGSPSLPKGGAGPTAALLECGENFIKAKIISIDGGTVLQEEYLRKK